jgi:hypothetical protein
VCIDRQHLPKEKKPTPKTINTAMGAFNTVAKAESFEHRIFLLMKPMVEKHHQKGLAYPCYNIVHYRRKNYGRGFLYWVKIKIGKFEWAHAKFRRQDDKTDPNKITITLL